MRFSRVSIIGTLAAAALALLVILPILGGARRGHGVCQQCTDYLHVEVGSLDDNNGATEGHGQTGVATGLFTQQDTRLGSVLYVSNDYES